MARIRSIKPDFWTDERIVELSAFARLLFIGLWNFADDDGRMAYSPKKIKMQIFPADTLDISELLGEIRRELLIEIYSIDNVEYLQIKNFARHQKIDKRTASKLPPPPNSPELLRIPTTEGKEREGNGTTTPREESPRDVAADVPPAGVVLPPVTPAGLFATALRKLGVSVTSAHPLLLAWVADGFEIQHITEAVELARMTKPSPQSIPPGYLDAILRKPDPVGRPAIQPAPVTPLHDHRCRHEENGVRCEAQGVRGKNGRWYCHEHKHVLEATA